MRLLKLINII